LQNFAEFFAELCAFYAPITPFPPPCSIENTCTPGLGKRLLTEYSYGKIGHVNPMRHSPYPTPQLHMKGQPDLRGENWAIDPMLPRNLLKKG
jgi:hypothetical protein